MIETKSRQARKTLTLWSPAIRYRNTSPDCAMGTQKQLGASKIQGTQNDHSQYLATEQYTPTTRAQAIEFVAHIFESLQGLYAGM